MCTDAKAENQKFENLSEFQVYTYDVYDADCVTVLKSHRAQFYHQGVWTRLTLINDVHAKPVSQLLSAPGTTA